LLLAHNSRNFIITGGSAMHFSAAGSGPAPEDAAAPGPERQEQEHRDQRHHHEEEDPRGRPEEVHPAQRGLRPSRPPKNKRRCARKPAGSSHARSSGGRKARAARISARPGAS
jgi:hypothetical protein